MKVLILGGYGFIGSYLAEYLVNHNYDVTILDKPGISRNNISKIENKMRIVEGDFNDMEDICEVVKGMQVVVHLISTSLPSGSL